MCDEIKRIQKEVFLSIQTYEEFDRRRAEFDHLKIDKEVLEHMQAIFPRVSNTKEELYKRDEQGKIIWGGFPGRERRQKERERRKNTMTAAEMLQKVDHTQLKAFATWEDIRTLCEEAVTYHTASVCVPPCYVKRIHDTYGEKLTICTVVGFPLGYSVTAAKEAEVRQALAEGCDEIDMVINISDVKNGDYEKVEQEIRTLKAACGTHILKVIIETCYLTDEEKIALCEIVTRAGADFIKTSTGFGTGGATREDVELFKAHIGDGVQIKAAGGVSTLEDLEMFLGLGCARIGTSRAVGLCKGVSTEGY